MKFEDYQEHFIKRHDSRIADQPLRVREMVSERRSRSTRLNVAMLRAMPLFQDYRK